jgi:hypothetical protein
MRTFLQSLCASCAIALLACSHPIPARELIALSPEVTKRKIPQASRHTLRNALNRCPRAIPTSIGADDIATDTKGTTWKYEGRPFFHGGMRTFRGIGYNSACQCSYDEAGILDDTSPTMGTADFSPPYGDNGKLDFPGDIVNLLNHFTTDIIPHLIRSDYLPNLTKKY